MSEKQNEKRNKKYSTSAETIIKPSALFYRSPCQQYIYNEKFSNHITIKANDCDIASYDERGPIMVSKTEDKLLLENTLLDELMTSMNSINEIETVQNRIEFIDNTAQHQGTLISNSQIIYDGAATNIDIYQLHEIIEISYTSIWNLLNGEKKQMRIEKKQEFNLINNVKSCNKLMRLESLKRSNNMVKNSQRKSDKREMICYSKLRSLTAELPCKYHNACKPCGSCKIKMCEFNSLSIKLFKILALLSNSDRLSFATNQSNHVISGYKRDWHIRSVTQGYFLTILLKNCNLPSLNVMRKLYFVIITSDTPNLSIELNLKSRFGIIFMEYDIDVVAKCPLELTKWNNEHRNIIDKSKLNAALCEARNRRSRNELQTDDIDARVSESSSSYCYSNSTLKNETTAVADETDDLNTSVFYSESNSDSFEVKSNSSFNMELKSSDSTFIALTLSITTIASAQSVFDIKKASGNTNFPRRDKFGIQESIKQQSIIWFTKLFEDCLTLKAMLGIPHLRNDHLINETMFNNTLLDEYVETIARLWTQFTSQEFSTLVYFKGMGRTIINTLL